MRYIALLVLAVLLIGALAFGGQALDLWSLNFWGPKYATARYHIFQKGQAYTEGQKQQLELYRSEYIQDTGKPLQQKGICSLTNEQYAAFDHDDPGLSQDDKDFLSACSKEGN